MNYNITRNGILFKEVRPTGKIYHRIMAEERVEMNFSLYEKIKFKLGDAVVVLGREYVLRETPVVTQRSTREWAYQLNFTSLKYRLNEISLLFYDHLNFLTESDFSLMGTAEEMVDLVVTNANRVESGWTRGSVQQTDTRLISFRGANTLEALTMIADLFDLEFWVREDQSIHMLKYQPDRRINLAYGQDQGIREIVRRELDDTHLVTRLIPKGSDRNLPVGYRNGSKNLRISPIYLQKNVSEFGLIEEVKYFEDIYPMRTGTVTGIDAENPKKFTDNTMDFDLNATDGQGNTTVLIPGLSAKVVFQTGQLAGYEFEIQEGGYHTPSKTFTLLQNENETAWEIPSELVRPAVGDKYILFDIQMPTSYVLDAENRLRAAAQDYLDENAEPRYIYRPNLDPLYFRRRDLRLDLGEQIRINSVEFGTSAAKMRIVALSIDLQDTYDQQPELAEAVKNRVFNRIKKRLRLEEQLTRGLKTATRQAQNAQHAARTVMGYFDEDGKLKPEALSEGAIEVVAREIIDDETVSDKKTWSSEFLEEWALNDYANRLKIKSPAVGEIEWD